MGRLKAFSGNYRAILRLGAPILVGQLGTIVVGFADNIMVGRYSTEALASASFVNSLFNVVVFCLMGFTYGILPLVGALFGGRDDRDGTGQQERIGALLRNAVALNVLFAMAISVIMLVVYFNIHRLGQPAELLPTVRPYYLLFLAGLVPVALFNALAQWSYGIKNTTMPMWVILAANVINVVGNYALIYGKLGMPEMGLTGAGVSTLVARIFSAAAMALWLMTARRNAPYRRGWVKARIHWPSIKRVWLTSIPLSLQMTFESGSFSVAGIMAGWLGAVPLAAIQIIIVVGMLGFTLYYAVGSAISVLVSQEAGRGSSQGMRRAGWAGYHIMLVVATCSSLAFVLLGRPLIHMFTDDGAVLAAAVAVVLPLVLYQLGDATQICFANALRGTSHVMPMLWIAFVSYIVVGIPATYLLAFTAGLGLYGIVLSFSVSLFLAGALFLTFFLRSTRPAAH